MSSLFRNRQSQPTLQEFARSMTPQQAQERIQQMLQSGQVTQEQYQLAISRAQEIARQLGIK